MSEFLEICIGISLAAAFVVLLVKKWGIAEWMQVHGDRFSSQLFGCDLCMSFWAGVLLSLVAVAVSNDASYLLCPFFTTPITRMLV